MKSNLTWRGLILLSFGLYLLLGPVKRQHDVVAAILGTGLLVLLGATLGATLFIGFRRRQSIAAFLQGGFGNFEFSHWADLPSKVHPHLITLELSRAHLPPGYHLSIAPLSTPPLQPEMRIVIPSNTQPDIRIPFQLLFPHRGTWRFESLDCTLRDNFGLTAFSWRFDFPVSVEVTSVPPFLEQSQIPLYTSASREGDLMTSPYDRHGDPFDIKAYQPSDGMRKIVWKLYAKRRELYSRHPEFAASPEGLSAVMIWASESEDEVCSEALAYGRKLLECDIGIRAVSNLATESSLATSLTELFSLCARFTTSSVFAGPSHVPHQIDPDTLVARLCDSVSLQRALIFCSTAATHANSQVLERMGTLLQSRGVLPIFVVVPTSAAVSDFRKRRTVLEEMKSQLYYPTRTQPDTILVQPALDFVNVCYKHNWQIENSPTMSPNTSAMPLSAALAAQRSESYTRGRSKDSPLTRYDAGSQL